MRFREETILLRRRTSISVIVVQSSDGRRLGVADAALSEQDVGVGYRPPVADAERAREHAFRAPLADETGG